MERQEGNGDPNARPEHNPRDGVPPGFDNQMGRIQNPVVNEEDMLFSGFLEPPRDGKSIEYYLSFLWTSELPTSTECY